MAEQVIEAIMADTDGDNIPDRLKDVLNSSAFGAGKDNWKNRRRLVIGFTVVCLACSALIAVTWAILALMGKGLNQQLADLAGTMIWAFLFTGTGTLGVYIGTATLDQGALRKAVTNATSLLGTKTSMTTSTSVDVSSTPN